MEFRLFQILVPLVSLIFIGSLIMRRMKAKATIYETILSILFWIVLGVLAIIPDTISNFVAHTLGFKSNVNAIIFLSLGAIMFIQFKTFNLIKEHEKALTRLTRKLAIKEGLKEIE